MADRVTDYALKSLARYIRVNLSGVDSAYVVTPDFDWDKKPTQAAPGDALSPRPLPFAGIVPIYDEETPFSMGNILYERNIQLNVELCCQNPNQLFNLSSDLKQTLIAATNPQTGGIGIVLYNFAVASGSYYANAGTMQIELGRTEFFGPEDVHDQGNRKYRSITPMILTAFKDSTATLLENMGRVDLTDS